MHMGNSLVGRLRFEHAYQGQVLLGYARHQQCLDSASHVVYWKLEKAGSMTSSLPRGQACQEQGRQTYGLNSVVTRALPGRHALDVLLYSADVPSSDARDADGLLVKFVRSDQNGWQDVGRR